jgi:hypothetical protein
MLFARGAPRSRWPMSFALPRLRLGQC